jgi:hypothetical protein
MSPVQGFTRDRKHQFGRQADIGTAVAATRAYPFKGVPAPDLQWTDPDIDVGSIDPVAAPDRMAPQLPASLTAPSLKYNDLPLMLAAIFGGNETPTPGATTAQTWTHKPASKTVDPFDPMTYEFGDDVLDDWYQFRDGVLDSLEITGPEGLGALSAAMTWRFGAIRSTGSTDAPVDGTVPTTGLDVALDDATVYLKDIGIYISTVYADLATSQIMNALHSFVLRISQPVDEKRFANGDQEFDVDDYGRQARAIELELTFAKTDDTVGLGSESDAWLSDDVVNRYIRFKSTSKVMAEGVVPYSWQVTIPARYYTRTEGEIGGNSVIVLTAHAYLEPTTFAGVFESILVNTLDEAHLGIVGS